MNWKSMYNAESVNGMAHLFTLNGCVRSECNKFISFIIRGIYFSICIAWCERIYQQIVMFCMWNKLNDFI